MPPLPNTTTAAPTAAAKAKSHLRLKRARLIALGPLALGIGLIALALPYFFAGFAALSGDPVVEAIKAGAPLPESALTRLIESRQAAESIYPKASYAIERGMAELRLAEGTDLNPTAKRAHFKAAHAAFADGLAAAPGNAYAWAQLAYIETRLNGPSAKAADALYQSIVAAPYEPTLLLSRVGLAAQLRAYWSAELSAAMPSQIRKAFSQDPGAFVTLAVTGGFVPLARAALLSDPALTADFDSRYQTLFKPASTPAPAQATAPPPAPAVPVSSAAAPTPAASASPPASTGTHP